MSDLSNYKAVYRTPVSFKYRGYDVYGMSMPSSGGVTTGMILNLLEGTCPRMTMVSIDTAQPLTSLM
jgi:gamma-glutamyltranspeptidase